MEKRTFQIKRGLFPYLMMVMEKNDDNKKFTYAVEKETDSDYVILTTNLSKRELTKMQCKAQAKKLSVEKEFPCLCKEDIGRPVQGLIPTRERHYFKMAEL